MAERTCRICGVEVAPTFQGDRSPNRYRCCSVECQRTHWRLKSQERDGTATKTSKQCAMCDRPTGHNPGSGRDRKFCSRRCAEMSRHSVIAVLDCACGATFVVPGRNRRRTRCDACQNDHLTRKARSDGARHRARKRGATVEVFTNHEVFERDGWRCGLCGQRIDRNLRHPHPKSVSIDHVVPLSKGGDHSLANTQASHLDCNMAKSNGVLAPQQLRLVG